MPPCIAARLTNVADTINKSFTCRNWFADKFPPRTAGAVLIHSESRRKVYFCQMPIPKRLRQSCLRVEKRKRQNHIQYCRPRKHNGKNLIARRGENGTCRRIRVYGRRQNDIRKNRHIAPQTVAKSFRQQLNNKKTRNASTSTENRTVG